MVDIGFALSALGWCIRDLRRLAAGEGHSAIFAALAGLNAVVAWLFLRRRPPTRVADLRATLWSLASVVVSGVALSFALPHVGGTQSLLFACGACGAAISLLALGPAFSILPADRGVVRRGPYRIIRHPAYAFELSMVLVVTATSPPWPTAGLVVASIVAIVVRIRLEEALLSQKPDYQDFARQVRWRLLPGVY